MHAKTDKLTDIHVQMKIHVVSTTLPTVIQIHLPTWSNIYVWFFLRRLTSYQDSSDTLTCICAGVSMAGEHEKGWNHYVWSFSAPSWEWRVLFWSQWTPLTESLGVVGHSAAWTGIDCGFNQEEKQHPENQWVKRFFCRSVWVDGHRMSWPLITGPWIDKNWNPRDAVQAMT